MCTMMVLFLTLLFGHGGDGDVNCTASGNWPGDSMTKKDGLWYWELPAGKIVPTMIIISEGTYCLGYWW